MLLITQFSSGCLPTCQGGEAFFYVDRLTNPIFPNTPVEGWGEGGSDEKDLG